MTAPEFSRSIAVARLPHGGKALALAADAAECAALARRFDLPALARLAADLWLKPLADGRVRVTGSLAARVTQVCVVSLEPFAHDVAAPVAVTFVPRDAIEDDAGALSADAVDEEPFDGDLIDVGEMLAQALSLALDPWPRNPDAELPAPGDAAPRAAGDDEALPPASPFAALARRRR
jgi:uncharacterized metal-binding protein YceD (DUF177 family)